MVDVIPSGSSIDSEFLFARMAEVTLAALQSAPGQRVIDVAAGVGQDDRALARRGVFAIAAEPSMRMTGLARLRDAEERDLGTGRVGRVCAWSEALPFGAGTFDAAFCKGSLDHFDDPLAAVREMARVTRHGGRVVLAIANFDSLGCRLLRWHARWRWHRSPSPQDRSPGPQDRSPGPQHRSPGPQDRSPGLLQGGGRRHFDVPSDHYTRYDPELIRRQLAADLSVEQWTGVSLLWGLRSWSHLLAWLGPALARPLLRLADRLARWFPSWSDVIVVAGQPRDRTTLA